MTKLTLSTEWKELFHQRCLHIALQRYSLKLACEPASPISFQALLPCYSAEAKEKVQIKLIKNVCLCLFSTVKTINNSGLFEVNPQAIALMMPHVWQLAVTAKENSTQKEYSGIVSSIFHYFLHTAT